MGRHSTTARRRRRLWPALAAGIVVVLGTGTWVAVSARNTSPPCTLAKVTVAATPDVAPAVTLVANGLNLPCAVIDVQSRDATQVAESLAISDGSPRPQLWLPDSTLALRRAGQLGAQDVPSSGPSMASSPVVLAVDADAAKGLGWPARTLTWAAVLAPGAAGIVTGIPDPARDPVGMGADEVKASGHGRLDLIRAPITGEGRVEHGAEPVQDDLLATAGDQAAVDG